MEQTIQISAELMPQAEVALTKANKRATKLGVPLFTITFGETYLSKDDDGIAWEVVDATVTGEQPKYEGWRLLARVQNQAGAVIISEVPGETVPAEQRERLGLCDQCGKTRKRTATFVIGHDDGSIKQVGRQCLADFLGSRGETVTSIANWMMYLEALLLNINTLGQDEDGNWGGRSEGPRAYSVGEYLLNAAKVIGANGWRPSAQGGDATKYEVWEFLACDGKTFHPGGITRNEYETLMAVEVDEEEIRNVIEWALDANGNTYLDNIAEVARAGIVNRKTNGLMASVIPAFRKQTAETAKWLTEKEEALKDKEEALKSQFVGTVGERVRDRKVVIIDQRFFDNDFGGTTLYKMVDANGNRFCWWTSTSPDIDLWTANRAIITGTVKEHKVYNDIKETILTRCKASKEVVA